MKKSHQIGLTTTLILALTLATGSVVATGDQSDPLVTLSYLEQTVTPALEQEARTQALTIAEDFHQRFDKEIALLQAEFNQLESSGVGTTHQYKLVTLEKNQSITLGLGAQVVLRSGKATPSGGTFALADLTQGGTLANGVEMSANHLYLASSPVTKITASESAKVMVYGSYS